MAGFDLLLKILRGETAGDYVISNVRLVAGGRSVLDVTPSRVPLRVIEQVLITSVKTRPLTQQEIKDKGIVLDRNDYLGFEFTFGVKLESRAVTISLPVVFDRSALVPIATLESPPASAFIIEGPNATLSNEWLATRLPLKQLEPSQTLPLPSS